MTITKTSKVWIFVLAAHGNVATSYFVHVLRYQRVELAQAPLDGSGQFALVSLLLFNPQVI